MREQETPPGQDAAAITVVQFVNTLAVSDGGPARNSLEVNLSLNARPDVTVDMFWMRSSAAPTVVDGETRSTAHVRPLTGNRRQALAALKTADVAIIHGFYLLWIPVVVSVCWAFRVPYVIMPHGVFTDFQRRTSTAKKRVFDVLAGRAIRTRAAAFFVATEDEAAELLAFEPAAHVSVCGVGTTAATRTAQGDPHTPLRLASMSRIAPKKRIDVAVATVRALRDRGVAATLDVAGTGDPGLIALLQSTAVELGVGAAVTFHGELTGDRKAELLSTSDVFLAPSEDENFGISVAEALAHGLPVVATPRVNAAKAAEGVAATIIDEPSADLAADAVANLVGRLDFADARRDAIRIAQREFSWEAVAARWHSGLLAASRARGPAAG